MSPWICSHEQQAREKGLLDPAVFGRELSRWLLPTSYLKHLPLQHIHPKTVIHVTQWTLADCGRAPIWASPGSLTTHCGAQW